MNKTALAAAVTLTALANQATAAFLEDSKATLTLRNFYYDRNDKNTANNNNEASEWGQGLIFNYSSGFTEGTVGFGLDAIALVGLRLDSGGRVGKNGHDRNPGQLFPVDSDGSAEDSYSKGGVTAKVRLSKTIAQIGTLQPKLPVININDSRLLPQTYKGGQVTSNEIDRLTLIAGQLESTKTRSSSDDIGMRIAGSSSAADTNKFYYAGGDYKITDDLTAQYYYANLEDYYKQHFLGLVHNWKLPVGNLKTDLRYFNSSSDGKNSSASGRAEGYRSAGYWAAGDSDRGEVDNQTWSALFTYSLSGHWVSAGYQQISGDSAFPFLNQGDGSTAYLFTNRQIGKFTNAGERSWVAEYGYDFSAAGVPGLKASINYVSGDNIDAADGDRKEWERDFRVDYVLQEGSFKGLGFTWRNATLRGNNETDQDENQLFVTYSLPLL
ncbi:OprD family porin [Pseudomonas sp. TTU2014-080ASC]|uniref:OprD family porin n=1 Tax=Pseudomonas sp. TTU2014-080ASC TaxID=1729724 RepID=UPI000718671E|nr:OprD family porin [Pseudomonas sp. TTU2014-080ASC]KRW58535.1 porin [Pseudomonas sp. TTU2014-080ASC]